MKNVKEGVNLPHRFVMTIYKMIGDLDREVPPANSGKEKVLQCI